MATACCSCVNVNLFPNKSSQFQIVIVNGGGNLSFFPSRDLACPRRRTAARRRRGNRLWSGSKNMDFVVRNAMPEAVAGDVIASSAISIPGVPFSIPTDNPWIAGIAALVFAGPLWVQYILNLTRQVDTAAQTVEKIADAVEKVAEEVDKAAESIVEKLPEGRLKQVAQFVEHIAEEVDKDAEKVEALMDKVEEINEKLETFVKQQSKGADKKA